MSNNVAKTSTYRLVGTAIFTAIVVVLQFIGFFLRFGTFSISLVLMPIVLGAALFGVASGAWLGLVFGIVVLVSGDAAPFLAISVPGTVITVIAKGVLAGFVCALAYKLIENKNRYAAVLVSSILCPVVNTGVFLLGCRIFFFDTISQWASGEGVSVYKYMIFMLVGINFIIELAINLLLDPVILRILDIANKTGVKKA